MRPKAGELQIDPYYEQKMGDVLVERHANGSGNSCINHPGGRPQFFRIKRSVFECTNRVGRRPRVG